MSNTTQLYDIVILGSGPAGCAAAIAAMQANRHISVALIDKQVDQQKIGEALLTGTLMTLHELGLAEKLAQMPFQRKRGAAYVWGESRDTWHVLYPPLMSGEDYPAGFTLPDGSRETIHVARHVFDRFLLDEAISLGATFIQGQADVNMFGEGENSLVPSVNVGDINIRAKEWIDATGQAAILSRKQNMRTPLLNARVARYTYLSDLDWRLAEQYGFSQHYTNIISSERGWMWLIHLGDVTSVGFVLRPGDARNLTGENALSWFPDLEKFGVKKIRHQDVFGQPMDNWHVHPDYSWRSTHLHGLNWSLAGDAAIFVDPILSQGVTLACHYGAERGRAAVARIDGDKLAQGRVSEHYLNECKVLTDVVRIWYSNNRSVDGWRLHAADIARNRFKREMDRVAAFQWLTNLENIREQFDPYSDEQNAIIREKLKIED